MFHLFHCLDISFSNDGEKIVGNCSIDVKLLLHEVGRETAAIRVLSQVCHRRLLVYFFDFRLFSWGWGLQLFT